MLQKWELGTYTIMALFLADTDGLDKIEDLQYHVNQAIYMMNATRFLSPIFTRRKKNCHRLHQIWIDKFNKQTFSLTSKTY